MDDAALMVIKPLNCVFFPLVFKVEMCVGSSSSGQLCFRKRKLAEAADFHLGLVWMQSDSGRCRHKQM